jgi:hypothetical protein
MAMTYAGDLCYIQGKYKDAQGVEKNRYVKCGAYFSDGERTSIKIELVPVGIDPKFGLFLSMFPKKDESQKAPPKQEKIKPNYNDSPNNSGEQVPF